MPVPIIDLMFVLKQSSTETEEITKMTEEIQSILYANLTHNKPSQAEEPEEGLQQHNTKAFRPTAQITRLPRGNTGLAPVSAHPLPAIVTPVDTASAGSHEKNSAELECKTSSTVDLTIKNVGLNRKSDFRRMGGVFHVSSELLQLDPEQFDSSVLKDTEYLEPTPSAELPIEMCVNTDAPSDDVHRVANVVESLPGSPTKAKLTKKTGRSRSVRKIDLMQEGPPKDSRHKDKQTKISKSAKDSKRESDSRDGKDPKSEELNNSQDLELKVQPDPNDTLLNTQPEPEQDAHKDVDTKEAKTPKKGRGTVEDPKDVKKPTLPPSTRAQLKRDATQGKDEIDRSKEKRSSRPKKEKT